ncbi:hypothetical protein [Streptomyces sp. NBC_00344]|uniref:hypothetical protein n=1 Tax=Streptomyces sp. NBC_00344 TaxID=2975720 RepID=UPI002E230343
MGTGAGTGEGAEEDAEEPAAEHVLVRCPSCFRVHTYTAAVLPCACGAPLAPPLLKEAPPEPVAHRTWSDDWVTVRCAACGRQDEWPQPELGCSCGTVLRIRVREASTPPASAHPAAAGGPAVPGARAGRPEFRPVTIRTARDAVSAAALYLRWLGFRDVQQPDRRPASGIDLRGRDLVATVEASTRPAALRDIECLWLNGLSASAVSVCFSLAGYADEARARADELAVPLFVMDLTGAPQPVNEPATHLVDSGA